mmetsp:Transcript_75875/g.191793  ORF Transcript_75875/g.191793 Transcript_75875/m.191793 type:complete len:435 (-) Transcript_75875:141-1445(-)
MMTRVAVQGLCAFGFAAAACKAAGEPAGGRCDSSVSACLGGDDAFPKDHALLQVPAPLLARVPQTPSPLQESTAPHMAGPLAARRAANTTVVQGVWLLQDPAPGSGCKEGAVQHDLTDSVVACQGAWTAKGVEAGGTALCATGWKLCSLADMDGLPQDARDTCRGMKGFYAAAVSSVGYWSCDKKGMPRNGVHNDVWGCGTSCSAGSACGETLKCALGNDHVKNHIDGWSYADGWDSNTEYAYLKVTTPSANAGVMCCADRSLCSFHDCAAGKLPLPNADLIQGDDDEACCGASCSGHICAEGFVMRPNASSILGSDDATCCEVACSSHVCATGTTLLPNASSVPGNDDQTCCRAAVDSPYAADGYRIGEWLRSQDLDKEYNGTFPSRVVDGLSLLRLGSLVTDVDIDVFGVRARVSDAFRVLASLLRQSSSSS